MVYVRPTIVTGVTKTNKAFWDNVLDGIGAGGLKVPGVPGNTDPASVPVVRALGDPGSSTWEYINNGSGYIWHILTGADSTSGAWSLAIGVDNGLGNGMIVRNKAGGVGVKLEQVPTQTSPSGYLLTVQQNSLVAPAVYMLQNAYNTDGSPKATGGAAPLMVLQSNEPSNSTSQILKWIVANGDGGYIRANDGYLIMEKANAEWWDTARIDARDGNGTPANVRNHVYHDKNGITLASTTGSPSLWWSKRVTYTATTMDFQVSSAANIGSESWQTLISLDQANKIGFFGATPVVKPTLAAAATDLASAVTLVNSIRTALINLGLAQ